MAQAVVQSSCRKLRSTIGDEATKHLNLTGNMQELLEQLEAIDAVILNAEKYWWTANGQDRGKDWWTKVMDAAYMICHMVDDMQDTMRTPAARDKLAENVNEIKEKLKELHKESLEFDAQNMRELLQAQDAAAAVGREKDIDEIVAWLTARPTTEGPVILLIHGFLGVGKATVAAMVFEHEQFKRYSRVWINHSNMLGLHEIAKYIISQVSAGEEETTGHGSSSNDDIMKQLRSVLNGKKVLLVLHDLLLWGKGNQWKRLKDMLSVGDTGIGSTQVLVIATVNTCTEDAINSTEVKKTFGVQPYCLGPLSDHMCCKIIKQAAVPSQDRSADKEDLEKVAPQIAKLCKGIPLAAQLFGSVLQFKEYRKWPQAFLTPSLDPVDISLKLSYRSMPPNLRLCFAYCAIFKMERIIVKEDLIHQWIALDLIEPSEAFSTTHLAEQYLKRLLDMSLLQTTPLTSAKDGTCAISFTMHRVVREFAANSTCNVLCVLEEGTRSCHIEHCSYALVIDHDKPLKSIFPDQKIRALRCLGYSGMNLDDSFSFARHLRVLELHDESSMQKLPESICELRHLGYLKLSGWSGLVTLPESIGDLVNLLHINLSSCSALVNLPESFGKLIKLEHINLSGCRKLANLPETFGKLTSLVHINLSVCYGLSKLPESFGKLISLLHINLSGCTGLKELPQSFGDLQNLLHIDLSRCYGLSKLPESFVKLKKLVHLDLSFWSCSDGIQTALGGLTSLEHLNLSHPCCYRADYHHLQGLKEVLSQFIRLKHLNLSMFLNPIFCNKSEKENIEYIEFISDFSRLEYLDLSHNIFLRDLPKSLGQLSRLHTLDLSGCIRLKVGVGGGGWMFSRKKGGGGWMDEMSVVLSNLESYRFVVGADNAMNNYRQLVDITCKELDISCLEKMKSAEEARRIRLAEKQNLQKLKLCWSVGCQRTVEDNVLLGELVAPHSVQHLELHGYSSTCFPSWLTPPSRISLLNLVEVTMEDITNCSQLPLLGLLPNLQRVVLRRMGRITRIDAGELIGGNTTAFNRLSKFTIDDMGSLKELKFYSSDGGEGELLFPAIDELVVHKCPKLSIVPLPPRVRRLVISDCNVKMVCCQNRENRAEGHGVEGPSPVPQVTEPVVKNCKVDPSKCSLLNHLTIQNCDNLACSPEIIGALSSLHTLCFSRCDQMDMLPEDLGGLSSLRELQIKSCGQLTNLPDRMKHLTSLRSMHLSYCKNIIELPSWLESLTSLEELVIEQCDEIKSLPQSIGKLTKLKDLCILGCKHLKRWCQKDVRGGMRTLGHIRPKFEDVQECAKTASTSLGNSDGWEGVRTRSQRQQISDQKKATTVEVCLMVIA